MASSPHPSVEGSGRIHICHLTVLNPARHSRIFYKEARSQVQAGYRVSIVGQDKSPVPYELEGVEIIPTGIFSRLSRQRWTSAGKIIRMAAQQEADIYQIHTPELLGPARRLLKSLPDARLLYDMHEDYALNIREGGYYPWWIRRQLARWARKKEVNFTRYGHGVIYAEDCFGGLIDFPSERTAFVRNKYLPPKNINEPFLFGDPSFPLLIYTGTIAENWGIFRAIELWKRLQEMLPVRLAVVGHSHDQRLLEKIHTAAQDSGHRERFRLIGGDQYVPYEDMVGWIAAADAGLALYTLRPNIRNRIPTKFYEFMAARKPVLHTPNPAWKSIFQPSELSIPLPWSPEEAKLKELATLLKEAAGNDLAYSSPAQAWHWDTEAEALLELLETVTKLPI